MAKHRGFFEKKYLKVIFFLVSFAWIMGPRWGFLGKNHLTSGIVLIIRWHYRDMCLFFKCGSPVAGRGA